MQHRDLFEGPDFLAFLQLLLRACRRLVSGYLPPQLIAPFALRVELEEASWDTVGICPGPWHAPSSHVGLSTSYLPLRPACQLPVTVPELIVEKPG